MTDVYTLQGIGGTMLALELVSVLLVAFLFIAITDGWSERKRDLAALFMIKLYVAWTIIGLVLFFAPVIKFILSL